MTVVLSSSLTIISPHTLPTLEWHQLCLYQLIKQDHGIDPNTTTHFFKLLNFLHILGHFALGQLVLFRKQCKVIIGYTPATYWHVMRMSPLSFWRWWMWAAPCRLLSWRQKGMWPVFVTGAPPLSWREESDVSMEMSWPAHVTHHTWEAPEWPHVCRSLSLLVSIAAGSAAGKGLQHTALLCLFDEWCGFLIALSPSILLNGFSFFYSFVCLTRSRKIFHSDDWYMTDQFISLY